MRAVASQHSDRKLMNNQQQAFCVAHVQDRRDSPKVATSLSTVLQGQTEFLSAGVVCAALNFIPHINKCAVRITQDMDTL